MPENQHIPVLLDSLINSLNLKKQTNFKVFDGTLGGGGYTQRLADLGFQVYASDLDQQALDNFAAKNSQTSKIKLTQGNFADVIQTFDNNFFDLIVLDLGYSSNQLEFSDRGFSYLKTGEILDLRYDKSENLPCWEKIQNTSVDKLWTSIFKYSGEKYAKPLARGIFRYLNDRPNKHEPVYVGQLVDVIIEAIPRKEQHRKNSVLSRVWQSLRIWTNHEFESLEKFLPVSTDKLNTYGKLAIVSFHSLEDKLVANFMRQRSKAYEIDSFGNKTQDFKLLTPKAITPSEDELASNIRSRSAMLRIMEKFN